MQRVRVNPYGPSNSAKELAGYLSVKRLLSNGSSRFQGRTTDVVINWGNGKGNVGRARQINKLENVQLASNKLTTFKILEQRGVSIPKFSTHPNNLPPFSKIVVRDVLSGHSGVGITVIETTTQDAPYPIAPLYVEYIEKVAEYRVIVVGNKVVDLKQKKKRASPRDSEGNIIEDTRIQHDPYVWNLDGGYIMAREGTDQAPSGIKQLGIDAVKALGLDFGAVDIIQDQEGTLYVLEVNTAFGLEGATIELVGNAIKELL